MAHMLPGGQTSQSAAARWPCAAEKRPALHLHGTEPWCFDHLLRYIHGLSVPLDIETAVQLFSVADYYAVVQLRDSCCNFLLEALRPENCCMLLARSHDVHCEQLTYRCMHTLVLEFVPVVENDASFPSISAELLQKLSRTRCRPGSTNSQI